MRTRLRACTRGCNYLPKDACKIPIPSIPSHLFISSSSSDGSGDESSYSEPAQKKLRCEDPLSWQEQLQTVLQRDMYIWQHSMWTDCTFCIGTEEEIFKCHRLFLAKTSPVFSAMLYGELHKNGEVIVVPDASPPAFRAMLQYVYEGNVEVSSLELACDLLYLAKKYLLCDKLQNDLRAFIWANMYPDHVWHTLTFALENNEPELYETALKTLCRDINAALLHPSFLEVPEITLVSALQQDLMHQGNEADLFQSCLSWSYNQLTTNGLSHDDTDSLRQVLEPLVPHIRFLAMQPEEFVKGPSKTELFSAVDKFAILSNIVSCGTEPLPNYICPKLKPNLDEDRSFFVFGCEVSEDDQALPPALYDTLACFEFTREESALNVLLSCQIASQTDRFDSTITDSEYDECISVYVINKSKLQVLQRFVFNKKVEYNSSFTCMLPGEMNLKDVDMNDVVQIKVVFHKTGVYAKVKNFNPTSLKSSPLYFKYNVIQRSSKFLQVVGHE